MKMFSKKLVSFLLAAVMIFSTLAVTSFAADADLAVSVDKETCLQGDTFTATVYFPAAYNKAAALDLELNYDKAKFELVSTEKGAGLVNAINEQLNGNAFSSNDKVAGSVKWTLSGSNNFNFSGVFAVIKFKVRTTAANGKTDITLKVTNVANSGYVDITSGFRVKGTSLEIIRNSVNDFDFKLNSAKNGYIVAAYRCNTVANLEVPSYYKNLPVVEIADNVFSNHRELVEVKLPAHLAKIGTQAFSGCLKLTKIEIPDSVESLGAATFYNCQALESVKLPLGISTLGANTFYSCYSLRSIEIPFTVKSIGDSAFYGCLTLSKVKISKNTEIGLNAFASCSRSGVEFTTVEGNTKLPAYIETSGIKATTKFVEDLSLGKVTEVESRVEYTGAPIAPVVAVTLNNGKAVKDGVEYKVVYVNNTALGKAKVYVVGIDTYGEGYAQEFEIYCDHVSVKRVLIKKQNCTENGAYNCKCNHCGLVYEEVIPATGHPSGEWVYDKLPTYDKTGVKHKKCTICGAAYDKNTVAEKIVPDVNEDTKVNSQDALLILQKAVGKNVYISPVGLMNADPNGDTKINSQDALIVLQISVGKIQLDK
jgi:hypothetical protein